MPFKKGKSGNPGGRPPGSKNALTLLKETVLTNSQELVLRDWEKVVGKTLELAQKGDTACLKILWDRMVPTQKASDGNKAKVNRGVTIVINGIIPDEPVEAEVIEEAEFEEIPTTEEEDEDE